jgi:cytochrome P450 family 4
VSCQSNQPLFAAGNCPKVQETLYEALTSEFNANQVDFKKLLSNKYLDACIKECLRLFPPVPEILRELTEDVKICGFDIPKGVSTVIHLFELHRDPKLYPDPEKYDPNRFIDSNLEKNPPFSFVPFSAGPRNCIGQKFTMTKLKKLKHYLF